MEYPENIYGGPFFHGALISMTYTGDSQGFRECCISRNAASSTEKDRERTQGKKEKVARLQKFYSKK